MGGSSLSNKDCRVQVDKREQASPALTGIINSVRNRYLDLLGSIYIYNEHRGYTAIDRVIEAIKARSAADPNFLAAVEKHRSDERKHYDMFRRWFQLRGVMPFAVDRTCGHIDRFVEIMFRSSIDRIDTKTLVEQDALFAKLCRVVALTERRGYRQVEILLRSSLVQSDPVLLRIFRIIEKDEPSHWQPYEAWLTSQKVCHSTWWERRIDGFIHSELLFIKLPLLFLNIGLGRRSDWAHSADATASPPVALTPAIPL